jgi:hypothetical protein
MARCGDSPIHDEMPQLVMPTGKLTARDGNTVKRKKRATWGESLTMIAYRCLRRHFLARLEFLKEVCVNEAAEGSSRPTEKRWQRKKIRARLFWPIEQPCAAAKMALSPRKDTSAVMQKTELATPRAQQW